MISAHGMSKRAWRRVCREANKKGEVVLPTGEVIARREAVSVNVRCEGHIHTVVWVKDGPVILKGHDRNDREARLTLGDMGGKDCKCLAVYNMVKSGEGVKRTPSLGITGIIARPYARNSEDAVRRHRKRQHERLTEGDYDNEHGRDHHFMPPASDEEARTEWLRQSRRYWREKIATVSGVQAMRRDSPLAWLLWHRVGLAVVDNLPVIEVKSVTPDEAVVMVRERLDVAPLTGTHLPLYVVCVTADPGEFLTPGVKPRPRWTRKFWLASNGQRCDSPARAVALTLIQNDTATT